MLANTAELDQVQQWYDSNTVGMGTHANKEKLHENGKIDSATTRTEANRRQAAQPGGAGRLQTACCRGSILELASLGLAGLGRRREPG